MMTKMNMTDNPVDIVALLKTFFIKGFPNS